MRNFFLLFIIVFLTTVVGISFYFFFTTKGGDSVLREKEVDVSSLRCPDCNVILIGIDTLRADHLGSYGYFRDTSPNIDRWVETGVIFKNTFSASSKTTPSFMSILTSLIPTDHGILTPVGTDENVVYTKIDKSIKTLPQLFNERGYFTYALITTDNMPPEFGFGWGFDNYENTKGDGVMGKFELNRSKLTQWLELNKDRKFFVFYHDKAPHDLYEPPFPYNSMYDSNYNGNILTGFLKGFDQVENASFKELEDTLDDRDRYHKLRHELFWKSVDKNNPDDINFIQALYDGEIKWVDDFIGELQYVLEDTGLDKNTIIVFTSDHGEEFFEHKDYGHRQLYNEILGVPFIISSPTISQKIRIDERVRTIDIMPTILDMVGISKDINLRGESLLRLIKNPSENLELPIVSMQYDKSYPPVPTFHSFIKGDFKLIRNYVDYKPNFELYNLISDPNETKNLSEAEKDIVLSLSSELDNYLNDSKYIYKPEPIKLILDEERRIRLEAIGY